MGDFVSLDLRSRSPLQGLAHEAPANPGLTLRETWPFSLLQFGVWADADAAKLAKALGATDAPTSGEAGLRETRAGGVLLPLKPQHFLHLTRGEEPPKLSAAAQKLEPSHVDLSHARMMLTLSGEAWRWTLMKGGSLDFEAMEPGFAANTGLFKATVTLWVSDPDTVHLLVPYSFAEDFTLRLLDAAQDVGIALGAA